MNTEGDDANKAISKYIDFVQTLEKHPLTEIKKVMKDLIAFTICFVDESEEMEGKYESLEMQHMLHIDGLKKQCEDLESYNARLEWELDEMKPKYETYLALVSKMVEKGFRNVKPDCDEILGVMEEVKDKLKDEQYKKVMDALMRIMAC